MSNNRTPEVISLSCPSCGAPIGAFGGHCGSCGNENLVIQTSKSDGKQIMEAIGDSGLDQAVGAVILTQLNRAASEDNNKVQLAFTSDTPGHLNVHIVRPNANEIIEVGSISQEGDIYRIKPLGDSKGAFVPYFRSYENYEHDRDPSEHSVTIQTSNGALTQSGLRFFTIGPSSHSLFRDSHLNKTVGGERAIAENKYVKSALEDMVGYGNYLLRPRTPPPAPRGCLSLFG